MKKLLTIALIMCSMLAFAQEYFVGAKINNSLMMYPRVDDGDPNAISFGFLIHGEKGMTFNNEWRFGFETGFNQSIPKTEVFNNFSSLQSSHNYAPLRFTLAYHGYNHYRRVNPYFQLGLGYALGATNQTILGYSVGIPPAVIEVPDQITIINWGGFSGTFRAGLSFALKKKQSFLTFGLGYHVLTQTPMSGSFDNGTTTTDIDTDGLDTEVAMGAQILLGFQYRFIKPK